MFTGKILLAFSIICIVGSFTPLDVFTSTYPFLPFAIDKELEYAWERCPENTTNKERYKELLKEARECYVDFSDRSRSLCHTLKENVKNCSVPVLNYFADCLPEKSKNFPSFIYQGVVALIDAFCTSTGELLAEIMNDCLFEYHSQKSALIREECKLNNFKSRVNKYEHELPSTAEACQLVREIGNCWQESVNHDCESQTARELFAKFYQAALAGCDT